LKALSLILVSLFVSAPAFAAGGTGTITDVIYPAINFTMYALIIYWVLAKKVNLPQKLKERSENLKAEMDEAEKIKKEAEDKFTEISDKLTKMESEREKMLQQAKDDAQVLKQKIIEQADARKEEILRSAKEAAKLEVQKARADLKDEIFETAMALALEAAKNNVNSDDHGRILKETVGSISSAEARA
jgi:F-type H+-transporting ATPase subunit b